WFLLIHRTADALWLELSLPVGLDDTGRLAVWKDQVPLGAIALEQEFDSGTIGASEPIDVPVTRRVATE
ncbi:MAG: hypothetical protein KGR26_08500, partial [Cyanobacteria bacterium REEB65]|nr:hypothetical protein [Cyanobacteria bacterium REEB65]